MRSAVRFTLLCGILVPPLLAQGGQEADLVQLPSIRVDVNLVTLRFTIKDREGRLVNSLGRETFQVFEDGVAQEIVFFDPPRNTEGKTSPLRVAFLLDISGSTFATRSEEIAAATTFLESVHDFTQVGVFGFTDRLILFQDFTPTRSLALKAFRDARKHMGRTAIYDSLNTLIARMTGPSSGAIRNAVIVISDGMDSDYRLSAQTITLARQNGIAIYTILVPSAAQLYIAPAAAAGRNTGAAPGEDLEELQKKAFANLSLRSGGRHFGGFEAILDFGEVMAQINDDIFGDLYSLGYYTDDPYRDKQERRIRVEINHPNVLIPARFENLPQRLTAKKEFIAALFDNQAVSRLPENLRGTFREIGAELDLLTPRRQGGKLGLPFRIKISPYTLQISEEGIRTQFGVIGVLLNESGEEVVRLREIFRVNLGAKAIREGRGIMYTNKLLAPPGAYALKVALVEIPTWRMTAFESTVQIRDR